VRALGLQRFSSPSPWTLLFGVFWLLVVSGVTAWLTARSLPEPLNGALTPQDTVRAAASEKGYPTPGTAEVKILLQAGSHLVLDARPLAQFQEGHLPGAMSLPVQDFEGTFPELAPLVMSGMPVLVYCTGPRCDESLQLADRLREAGVAEIAIYVEGMQGWQP
jgi:rhodanese-related sulfurtransferase